MARLRLLLLALVVTSTVGCSSLTSCFEPNRAACYPSAVAGYPTPGCDCGGGPATGLYR